MTNYNNPYQNRSISQGPSAKDYPEYRPFFNQDGLAKSIKLNPWSSEPSRAQKARFQNVLSRFNSSISNQNKKTQNNAQLTGISTQDLAKLRQRQEMQRMTNTANLYSNLESELSKEQLNADRINSAMLLDENRFAHKQAANLYALEKKLQAAKEQSDAYREAQKKRGTWEQILDPLNLGDRL